MSVNNSVISAPIDFSDPYNCMGVAAQSNGYDVGYICANGHGKVNKWARYKPVCIDQPTEITEDQIKSVSCGLTPIKAVNNQGGTGISLNQAEWTYAAPSGTWWKRITDFNGYNHNALPPIVMETYEYTWDTAYYSVEEFYLTAFYKVGNYSFGNTSGIGIPLDYISGFGTDFGKYYWGLIYLDGDYIYCCNAEMPFNYTSIDSSKPPVCYPGKWQFKEKLKALAVGSSIEVYPVLNKVEYGGAQNPNNLNGNYSNPLYGFPTGKKVVIKKIFTPIFTLIRQGNIIIKNSEQSYYQQTIAVQTSTSSTSYSTINRLAEATTAGTYRILVTVTMSNTRTTDSAISANQFKLTGLLVNSSGVDLAPSATAMWSNTTGTVITSIPANTSSATYYLVFELTKAQFDTYFPYTGYATANNPAVSTKTIRLTYRGETQNSTGNGGVYSYRYWLSN